jgi:MFS superfamily sulfate permease-like transporter
VAAGATLLTMLFLAPLIGRMPQAVLAGLVIVYSVGLIEPAEPLDPADPHRRFYWALAACRRHRARRSRASSSSIILSLVALAYQVADPAVYALGRKPGTNVFRPRTEDHPEDESFPGLLIVRPEGRLFFANAERIATKIRALVDEAKPKVVAIDLSAVFDLEYTALKMLIEGEKRNREQGIELWLVSLTPNVLAVVQRSSLGQKLPRPRALQPRGRGCEMPGARRGSGYAELRFAPISADGSHL